MRVCRCEPVESKVCGGCVNEGAPHGGAGVRVARGLRGIAATWAVCWKAGCWHRLLAAGPGVRPREPRVPRACPPPHRGPCTLGRDRPRERHSGVGSCVPPERLPITLNTVSPMAAAPGHREGHPARPGGPQPPPETLPGCAAEPPPLLCTGQRLPIPLAGAPWGQGPVGRSLCGRVGVPGPTLQLPGPWAPCFSRLSLGPQPPCLCS